MVGRLIEQQQIGLARERERKGRPLPFAARGGVRGLRRIEAKAMQILHEPSFQAPTLTLVMDVVDLAADGQAFAQSRGEWQFKLLLDEDHTQSVLALEVAVIQRRESGDYLQERRLTGAVAADESDPLAFQDREAGAIEQGRNP